GGAFDITVGPLVTAWGFGPRRLPPEPPPEEELAELLPHVGFRLLELTDEGVVKKDPRTQGDLSAIAKGYAVDQVAETLEAEGFDDYMVEVGGEVRTGGHAPGGGPWRIGIEGPTPEGHTLYRVLPLSNLAVATSGDYRNFYEVNGRRYSHTLDPKTGRPVEHAGAAVSVVMEDCASADGWATALLVLGPDAGYDLATEKELAALFQSHEEGGGISVRQTPRFEALFGPAPPR
ncbi:MAG: FAD:protein FMN transferase, partial [Acidobacteria bacterium]|nr:FAD:protein FMN transferase [Acidobacteriota bacterium]